MSTAVRLLAVWVGVRRSRIPWHAVIDQLDDGHRRCIHRALQVWGKQPPMHAMAPFPVGCLRMLLEVAHHVKGLEATVCGIVADVWHMTDQSVRADMSVFFGSGGESGGLGAVPLAQQMVQAAAAAAARGDLSDKDMSSCMWAMHMMCRMLANTPGEITWMVGKQLSDIMMSLEAVLRRLAGLDGMWLCQDALSLAIAMHRVRCSSGTTQAQWQA